MPIAPGPLLFVNGPEIWIVLAVIVVIFGASRLPALGRNLGQGITEFKRGVGEAVRDDGKPDASRKPDTPKPDTPKPDTPKPDTSDTTPQDRPATTEQPADGTATREERA